MKKFFEEYGGVLIVAIVIIGIVVILGVFSGSGNGSLRNYFDTFVKSVALEENEGSGVVSEASENTMASFMTEEGDCIGDFILADISDEVTEITFCKSYSGLEVVDDYRTLEPNNGKAVDVSADGSGSVVVWLTGEGAEVTLNVAGRDGVVMAPANSTGLFSNFCNVRKINFNNCFNTSNVTNMLGMFIYCESLEDLDISSFDTSNVTNMGAMFSECYALKDINLKNIDTSKVEIMQAMFSNCESLLSLDLSSFDTRNVVYTGDMFYGCDSLKHLNLSNFETPKLENCACMFQSCALLEELNISKMDVTSVTAAYRMFEGCAAMKKINVGDKWVFNESADTTELYKNCGVSESELS